MASKGPKAHPVVIPERERAKLERLAHRTRADHRLVQRARIIVLSDKGMGTTDVARKVGCTARTVRKWKQRFRENPKIEALHDAPRSGRPSQIPVSVRCQLIKLACRRPDYENIVPFHEVWTQKALAEVLYVMTGYRLSVSEVGRILRFHHLRPHHVRMWLTSGDPDFDEKADRICQLYLAPPEGARVICVDEKPLQAIERLHPNETGDNGELRFEFEYIRNGTCCLLAAFDTQSGEVFGRVVPQRSAEELVEFMERLAKKYPEGDIYIVWDNLNTHYDGKDKRWTKFNARHGQRFHFVYTPKHASWMNQVEIWFSILQRRVIRHGSFDDPKHIAWQVTLFIHHYNRYEAHPFRWTWRSHRVKNPRKKKNAA